jgi:hypothetical protein
MARVKGTAVQSSLRYLRESAHSARIRRGDATCRFEGSWD